MPFASREFKNFAQNWGINTTTSSPEYPTSNGHAERFVQTCKNILRKADKQNRDPQLVLLEYTNTAISGLPYTPAQLLTSRLLCSKIPVESSLLIPRVFDPAHQSLTNRQLLQKKHYDKSSRSKPLCQLCPGDNVLYRQNKVWKPAVVAQEYSTPRSYIVNTNGGRLRRNRRHLRPFPQKYIGPVCSPNKFNESDFDEYCYLEPQNNGSEDVPGDFMCVSGGNTTDKNLPRTSRPITFNPDGHTIGSGRVIHVPARYKD